MIEDARVTSDDNVLLARTMAIGLFLMILVTVALILWINNLINENNDLRIKLDQHTSDQSILQIQVASFNSATEKFKKDNSDLKIQVTAMDMDNKNLVEKNKDLSNQLSDEKNALLDLQKKLETTPPESDLKIEALQNTITDLNRQLANLNTKYMKLGEQSKALLDIYNQELLEKAELSNQIKALEDENNNLKGANNNFLTGSIPPVGLITLLGYGVGIISGWGW
jgi:chromosome segregation ATPase